MTPDVSCEQCQDTLPWYVADALSHNKRDAVARHLATCARCRVALDEWRAVDMAVRRGDERIPLDTDSSATWVAITRRLEKHTPRSNTANETANERTTMRLHDHGTPNTPNTPNTRTPADESPARAPATRVHRRVHAVVSLVAVAALIALSVGIFTLLAVRTGSHLGNRAATATPQPACAPAHATASIPAHTILTAIAPVGTDDGWAVGRVWDTQQPLSPPTGLLLHLQDCHWAPVGTPLPKVQLLDISMVSPDDGWAVGVTMTLDTTPLSNGQPSNSWEYDQPLVLHYAHGSWQQVTVTTETKAEAVKVKMVSADEGWMLLYGGKQLVSSDINQSVGYQYSLLHYQNGTWSDVPMTFKKPQMAVADLDARQPGEVWLVGFDNSGVGTQPLAAHYSRGVWTPYTGATILADPSALASGAALNSVSELSPNDVWAAGGRGLYHFDGSHWITASIQGTPSGGAGNYTPSIGQIAMVAPTQGWAFPDFAEFFMVLGMQTKALHYDHGVWQWTTLQIQGAPAAMPIVRFVPSSPTQGWALAVHLLPNNEQSTDQETVLLYYDAGAWGVVRQQS